MKFLQSIGAPILLACLAAGTIAVAQPPAAAVPAAPHGPMAGPVRLQQIAPNVYWSSEGGNVGVVIGKTGVIVFDAKIDAKRASELQARVAEITPKPIRAVIVSHVDEDHVGGLGAFPAGIEIIAQTKTRDLLRADAEAGRGPVAKDRLPNHVVANRETVAIGGEAIQLLHWGPAHTSGNLTAFFPRERIVFAADIFCMDQPRPYIKTELGGNSAGWVRSAQAIMALKPRLVVVGHGEPQTPDSLRPFIREAVTERAGIIRLAAQGKTLPEIEAAVHEPQPTTGTYPPGAHLAQFAKAVYAEVAQRK